jgi:hypothetical protein
LYIQYTRKDTGDENDPKIFGKGFRPEDMAIEQRLVASVPDVSKASPTAFIDADLGGDKYTRKSTSGLVIMMNSGPVKEAECYNENRRV